MLKLKCLIKSSIVNTFKLIYLPLFIGVLAILIVSITSYHISKTLLLNQMEQDGINLAKLAAEKISEEINAIETINSLMEDKIRLAGKSVVASQEYLSNDLLRNIAQNVGVDEINWYNFVGEIIYSTNDEHLGWSTIEDHTVENFRISTHIELIEGMRKNSKTGHYNKYGYMRNEDESFVEVVMQSGTISGSRQKFSYQEIVESMAAEDNIAYALIVDTELKAIADSDVEDVGAVYVDDPEYLQALEGDVSASKWYYEKTDNEILEIVAPIYTNDEIIGIVGIGLYMDNVYASIYFILLSFTIITMIMVWLFLWMQRRNVIQPVKQLDENIRQINVENNISYRLPLSEKDTFLGLSSSINAILDKIEAYFHQLKEKEDALNRSNLKISKAYQELTASEEELRAQYTEIQSYTEKLEELKQKYDITIQGTNSVIWEIDIKEETIYFSREIGGVFSGTYKEKQNIYKAVDKLLIPEDKRKLIKEYKQYIAGEKDQIHMHVRGEDRQGNIRWYLVSGKGIYDTNHHLKSINGISLDVTTLRIQEEYIEHIAYHDPLTNLPNRRKFSEQLEEELRNNRSGAVMLLDLDNFKGINDTLGHVYGDKVLKKVAEALMDIQDESVFVSRFGGDEFLILITEENVFNIENYAKRIIDLFKNKLLVDDDLTYIGCSIGIALYPTNSNDATQLVMNADMAMHSVKVQGKNNYMFFNEAMLEKLNRKIQLQNILREALKEKAFKLLYQPQICTYTGKIIGFEALLRLKNNSLSPAEFIPVAEETGMIIEIGRWVTEEVIKQIRQWTREGLVPKSIAINFSAKQLNDLDYIEFLESKLKEYNVEPKYIEIEITENLFFERQEKTIEFLERLKATGLKIALDDFGTGYSSLSYLTFLPVDKIKLDKSLTDKYLETKNIKVIDGIISLAHSLKLEVVAEGIENVEQYKQLEVGGCNYIQGYLFSRPLEVKDVSKVYYDDFLEKIYVKADNS
ncbi:MAG: EAL domain-containing protein [Clostridiaceae bacterium]|nr:EAL domain-containing protein [Clostridiaceae bacterium]